MSTIGIVLSVILGILSVILTSIILLQSDRSAGLGAVGNSANSGSYWSKNKASSMEGALERYTKIGGALFLIICLLINFFA
ncbi:preprotein translocase subunit SecG [Tyzzerella sp. An114]|uniref:preprotein translocase subunit SecG n=1 Tax=Tyzzerella sp. An114 TaxID=1965545 RepID=UPI000B431DCD|nr:preprotein translocase subunit SecG [Tyzzerella sp. An114]OUQ58388.1 preprotein translocase subunit SecG [Tyzzerella sp. An114]HIT73809.1 preprotein translocase subunit SecG [Candidatus Fimicola cottocaccae]